MVVSHLHDDVGSPAVADRGAGGRVGSSGNRARSPAPDSTTTATPLLTSAATYAGTNATRRSSGPDSATTPRWRHLVLLAVVLLTVA